MDNATGCVLALGVIVWCVLGAGAVWFVVTTRARLSAAEAAKAAADATSMLRADAAGLRAERAGLVARLEELGATHDRAIERLRQAEAEAAAATAALRSEREAGAQRGTPPTPPDAQPKQAFPAP